RRDRPHRRSRQATRHRREGDALAALNPSAYDGAVMPFELTAALVVFLAATAWRLFHRRRYRDDGPLPDVGSAPASAEPVMKWRYHDDGLAMYSLEVPGADDEADADRH